MTFPPREDTIFMRHYGYVDSLRDMRHYFEVELSGSRKNDEAKLEAARSAITKLVATNDTINGVHFRFLKDSKYWSFIRVVDICEQAGQKKYEAYANDMWVFRISRSDELLSSLMREKEMKEMQSIPVDSMGYK